MADLLRGLKLTNKGKKDTVTVSWKQGSFIGFGGDRTQVYELYEYETPQGSLLLVYIQKDFDTPDILVCDGRIQYGMNNGVLFLVYHDKEQKPYQHRFVSNQMQKAAYLVNELVKKQAYGLDLLWVAGDYLRDI
ncbi:uncharacterized protein LOC123560283 [Mercenaria mercenaria]|uniref:uncharacterized protein LOC123560283 n=1 Tax=Mercenaria mercenaria TaxID=6596 RepID=UPI00234F3546|nr:uncharacterized protein LOC123560283 [Mercenaria mercenaria]